MTTVALRIAVLSPVSRRTPPRDHGRAQRIVSTLTERLVALGHEVTLFATADSSTSARLEAVCPLGMGESPSRLARATECLAVAAAFKRAVEFDVIHDHSGPYSIGYVDSVKTPVVVTHHVPLSGAHAAAFSRRRRRLLNVAVSEAARQSGVAYTSTVYPGVDLSTLPFADRVGDFVLFLGRIREDRGVLDAIEIARRADQRLLLAGQIDDRDFYNRHVMPRIDWRKTLYVGVVEGEVRKVLLSGAAALLHPVRPERPFALAPVEAMACGTPVVAYKRGCLSELVKHERTGFLVSDVDGAVDALRRVPGLRRRDCRAWVEERFSADRMVSDYLRIYEQATRRTASGAARADDAHRLNMEAACG
ncbi:MAG: glycosyltransferase family 4 protein [Acidobacteriota bacterium]